MKFFSFALLFSGFLIAMAAVALLAAGAARLIFVLAGVAVEVLGFSLAVRAHRERRSLIE